MNDFGKVTVGMKKMILPIDKKNPFAPSPLGDTKTVIAKDGKWKGEKVVPLKKSTSICTRSIPSTCFYNYYDNKGYLHIERTKGGRVISDKYAHRKIIPTVFKPSSVKLKLPVESTKAGLAVRPKWIKAGILVGIIGLIITFIRRKQ